MDSWRFVFGLLVLSKSHVGFIIKFQLSQFTILPIDPICNMRGDFNWFSLTVIILEITSDFSGVGGGYRGCHNIFITPYPISIALYLTVEG